jgi:steroid delta-isomerase-like uncharacterized protein
MSEENKAVVRGYLEQIWNKGRFDRFEEFMGKDLVPHGAAGVTDVENAKQSAAGFRSAFPDVQVSLEDEIAEGDKVVARFTISGTHQGDLPGLPATGKKAVWSGITIFRVVGGKIVEFWLQGDNLGMMQQLGAIPTPQAA